MALSDLVQIPTQIPIPQQLVEDGTKDVTKWWLGERLEKLQSLSSESMAVNPFLAPLVMGLNGFTSFDELASFLLGGHLVGGNNTGFGKLIDEKLLPRVFGTTKLTRPLRAQNPIISGASFDEIDHLVPGPNGTVRLLSLKSSRWTIQLAMAVNLNRQFQGLVVSRRDGLLEFSDIVVGVAYGTNENLTDKYDILRGINRGAFHDVADISDHVHVHSGRSLWSWANYGEDRTQDWMLNGILEAVGEFQEENPTMDQLVGDFQRAFVESYVQYVAADGSINWAAMLGDING